MLSFPLLQSQQQVDRLRSCWPQTSHSGLWCWAASASLCRGPHSGPWTSCEPQPAPVWESAPRRRHEPRIWSDRYRTCSQKDRGSFRRSSEWFRTERQKPDLPAETRCGRQHPAGADQSPTAERAASSLLRLKPHWHLPGPCRSGSEQTKKPLVYFLLVSKGCIWSPSS